MDREGEESKESRLGQYIGVGCFASVTGFFSCAMISVFIAKFVGMVQRCTPAAGLPACNYEYFLVAGGVLGATIIPIVVLGILRRGRARKTGSERS